MDKLGDTLDHTEQCMEKRRNKISAHERRRDAKLKRSGPPPPPIARVESSRRLFCLEEGRLRRHVSCFSFYSFKPIEDPVTVAHNLEVSLNQTADSTVRPLEDFAGTVYIAPEGVNGQFCVRPECLEALERILRSELSLDENIELNVQKDMLQPGDRAPFRRFRVVKRRQVLTDGLSDDDLSWEDAGNELHPSEWHKQLASQTPAPLILDCRNDYESAVGSFTGARPLDTKTFSESWQVLDEIVEGLEKDTPIFTFCTGGIRCVKVGAYLRQRHGLTEVNRLGHGIIGYERWIENDATQTAEETESLFEGTNFIFDQRPRNATKLVSD